MVFIGLILIFIVTLLTIGCSSFCAAATTSVFLLPEQSRKVGTLIGTGGGIAGCLFVFINLNKLFIRWFTYLSQYFENTVALLLTCSTFSVISAVVSVVLFHFCERVQGKQKRDE